MTAPLMPKATAVWLIENTTLTFEQISDFCHLHMLEVQGIADGEVAVGMKGLDPITAGQLSKEEIVRCEEDSSARLKMIPSIVKKRKQKGPRYTPIAKRQDKPDAIAWLLKNYPTIKDNQISKLIGTTKPTIDAIRNRTHWNSTNIRPKDPVLLGLCKQSELEKIVATLQPTEPERDDITGLDL